MSVDLSVEIAGVRFKNPLIVAAGTPTLSAKHIIRCFKAGAAGAVTKTITYDKMHRLQPKPRMFVLKPHEVLRGGFYSFYSIELMSELDPKTWVNEIRRVKKEFPDNILIASIAGRTLEEWEKLARLVDEAGADMVELNLSCPHVERNEMMGKAAARRLDIVKSVIKVVKDSVSIPVIGKLSPQGANPLDLARTMASVGVDAVVSTARFQGLVIDIESMKPILWGGFGGYGGPWQVPISVAWTAHIAMEIPDVPIIGSGGISCGEDAIQFILAGATAIQVCTAVIVRTHRIIRTILEGLSEWMHRKGFSQVSEFRGLALGRIKPLEKLERRKIFAIRVDRDKCTKCAMCARICPYDAISIKEEGIVINDDRCDNCGLCVALCPQKALSMIRRS
ncbi:MAG: hypothetical protein DRJ59_05300 [Thermoprotei archaeon]|nr:MAG: hypothetical protein DRJ59_05300 [Thermoprotei archaeon]